MKFNIAKKIINKHVVKSNIKKGVMAVEIKNTIGLGARLEWVLEILAFCEENDLLPQFKFTYPDSTKDYFESFFKIRDTYLHGHDSVRFVKIYTIGDLYLGKDYDKVLNIKLATYLIDKYLAVQDDILHEVDEFCNKYFNNKEVLGVHYRGTDKSTEASSVSYDKVEKNIKFFLDKFPATSCIFISSDDVNFISYAQHSSIGHLVLSRNDTFRSDNNEPVHWSNQNKYDINRDAIVNCLLLSRCDALLKTASILSAWSVLFNPKLPLVMLNKPFAGYFPERDLMKSVLYEPV